MASSRADEMVLAGSAPTQTPNSDPIGHIHRGTSFIVLVDAAIVVYLIATALNAMGLLNGTLGSVFLGVGMFTGLMIYSGYRNRKAWAYWPGVGVLFLASLMFAFLAFLNLLQGLLSGNVSAFLFVFLMGAGLRLVPVVEPSSTGTPVIVLATCKPTLWTPFNSRTARCLLPAPPAWRFSPYSPPCWVMQTGARTAVRRWSVRRSSTSTTMKRPEYPSHQS